MRAQLNRYTPYELSDAALAASRQVWLAGLGAAAVSRDWIQAEAGNTFKALVKEGSAVETRAMRYIGKGVGSSVLRANALWQETRHNVQSTVREVADNAVLFVRQNLPMLVVRATPATRKAASPKRATAKRGTKAKRTTKRRAR